MMTFLKNLFLRHGKIVAFFLLLCLSACSSKDDAEAIRQLIQKGAGFAEKKQIGDLLDLTADGFIAHPGKQDSNSVKRILFGAFMHYGQFKLHFPKPKVDMFDDGKNAQSTVYVLIVRQHQAIPNIKELYNDPRKWLETVGEKADLYQLKLTLIKQGGDWLVQEAQLEGFKGIGF